MHPLNYDSFISLLITEIQYLQYKPYQYKLFFVCLNRVINNVDMKRTRVSMKEIPRLAFVHLSMMITISCLAHASLSFCEYRSLPSANALIVCLQYKNEE